MSNISVFELYKQKKTTTMGRLGQYVCIFLCVMIAGVFVHAPTSRAFIENPGVTISKALFDFGVVLVGVAYTAFKAFFPDCSQVPDACKNMPDPEDPERVNQFLAAFVLSNRECTNAFPSVQCKSALEDEIVQRLQSTVMWTLTKQQQTTYDTCIRKRTGSNRKGSRFDQRWTYIFDCVKETKMKDLLRAFLVKNKNFDNEATILLIFAVCKKEANVVQCMRKYIESENKMVIDRMVKPPCVPDPNNGHCQKKQTRATRPQGNDDRRRILNEWNKAKEELTNECAKQIAYIHETMKEEERYRNAHIHAHRMLPKGRAHIAEYAKYASWIGSRNNEIALLEKVYVKVVHLCGELVQWPFEHPQLVYSLDNNEITQRMKKFKSLLVQVRNAAGANQITPFWKK